MPCESLAYNESNLSHYINIPNICLGTLGSTLRLRQEISAFIFYSVESCLRVTRETIIYRLYHKYKGGLILHT